MINQDVPEPRPLVLIPGAGGAAWYWHLVEAELRRHGHDVVAVDLPTEDKSAGLPAYADVVVAAVNGRRDIALVAQSMGAFTAPLVWQRVPTSLVVFVNAMIPQPGETPGDWWGNVGFERARLDAAEREGYGTDFDIATYFLHDVPADIAAEGEPFQREQADTPFGDVCTFTDWPDVPIKVVSGRDDRFFPLDLQLRLARERLGIRADVVPGGHLAALSHPVELAGQLQQYLREGQ